MDAGRPVDMIVKSINRKRQPEEEKKLEKKGLRKGVYYSSNSYAGFWARLFAWLIDIFVLASVLSLYLFSYTYLAEGTEFQCNLLFIMSFFSCFAYLTIVKTSEMSTLGFWVNKIKVVDLSGRKPHFFKMALRFILLTIGPFELILDLLWLTGETTKQTLRDKYVGTYVVKKDAEPIGQASIVQTRLHVLGWNLVYYEVEVPENQ